MQPCFQCGQNVGVEMSVCPHCGTAIPFSHPDRSSPWEEATVQAYVEKLSVLAVATQPPLPVGYLSGPLRPLDTSSFIGQQIGNFRILQQIGSGGFGAVYRAEQIYVKKPFAIKVLHFEQQCNETILKRFLREAQSLAELDHPNVVRSYDFGRLDAHGYYLVMEYIDGLDLLSWLKAGSKPLSVIQSTMQQICDALEHVHRQNLLHRDLKPSNILVQKMPDGSERIKLLDFGIAALLQSTSNITGTGDFIGTARYASPEQIEGSDDIDARSDLYTLGLILYQILTGRLPFDNESNLSVMMAQVYHVPPTLQEITPHKTWAKELETFLRRVLAKSPAQRPSHAAQFWQECQQALRAQEQLEHSMDGEVSWKHAVAPSGPLPETIDIHALVPAISPISPQHGGPPLPETVALDLKDTHPVPVFALWQPIQDNSPHDHPNKAIHPPTTAHTSIGWGPFTVLIVLMIGMLGAVFYGPLLFSSTSPSSSPLDGGTIPTDISSNETIVSREPHTTLIDGSSAPDSLITTPEHQTMPEPNIPPEPSTPSDSHDQEPSAPVQPHTDNKNDAPPSKIYRKVALRLQSSPSKATIYVDGEKVGTTPRTLWFRVGQRTEIVLKKPGFQTTSFFWPASNSENRHVNLPPNPRPPGILGILEEPPI